MRCQSVMPPSTAEYWHMGAITIRFASFSPPTVSGLNRTLIGYPRKVGGATLIRRRSGAAALAGGHDDLLWSPSNKDGSAVQPFYGCRRITLASGRPLRQQLVDPAQIVVGQRDGKRADVLLEIAPAARAGNGHDILALSENPGERELGRLTALRGRQLLDMRHEVEVALEVLALESRRMAPYVVLRQILEPLDLTGQKAAAQR